MKTIEINEIDAKAIEELANNRVLDWHISEGNVLCDPVRKKFPRKRVNSLSEK